MDDIFNCTVPNGEGVMGALGSKGDTKVTWNRKNDCEVENAKRTFDQLVGEQKFAAFAVSKLGKKSKRITKFDPELEKIIIVPPMAGGWNGCM